MVEELLKPVSADHPSGSNIRYDQVYDRVRQARRPDDGGVVVGVEQKAADHKTAIHLATDILATKSKDLWIAVWLTDSLIQRAGFAGLRQGLEVILGLIENYWDGLYPEIEDGDLELRASPLDWLGNYLELAKESSPVLSVRLVPLTQSGLNWMQYQESRKPGNADGKITAEVFDAGVDATPKTYYRELETELALTLDVLKRLDEVCGQKFGKAAPGFWKLRSALEEIQNTAAILLRRRLEQEPDPVPAAVNGIPAPPTIDDTALEPAGNEAATAISGAEPRNKQEASAAIAAAALYLRRSDPANPVPYLLLRAARWGELRAQGPELAPALLAAPPTELRTKIKGLAAGARWGELLEATEGAMTLECGRGWLDLQRYACNACEQLGYAAVAGAIKSSLRCLLADYPALAKATLSDDTGAANPETAEWLETRIVKG